MNYAFIFSAFLATCCMAKAQQANLLTQPSALHFAAPLSASAAPHSQVQSVNSFYIDYDASDAAIYGSSYQRFVWPVNNYHAPNDNAIRYCIVAFDSLYNLALDTGYAADSVGNLAIDSIFLMLGHENNSGIDDTLKITIIALDSARGYPLPSTIYWSEQLIIPAGSPLSGNWQSPVSLKLIPYLSLNTNRFGIMLEYFGDINDTLGIVAGFGFRDTCGTLNQPPDTTHFSRVRKQSSSDKFLANSYALWSQYEFIGILPTQNGSNIYFDCNNNSQYDGGVDGESYIQNIQFIAHVKTNAAAIGELSSGPLTLRQNLPNPCSGLTTVPYELRTSSHVTVKVYDKTGRTVLTQQEGKKETGAHTLRLDASQLDNGFYIYSLTADGVTLSRKMIVAR